MTSQEKDELEPVPLPSSETKEERERIRNSNDRDQELERDGKPSRHNQGYDEVADLTVEPKADSVLDE